MKKITIILIWLLLPVMMFPVSCDDGCGDFDRNDFAISGLGIESGKVFSDGEFAPNTSTDYRTAALRVSVSEVEVIASSNIRLPKLNLINAAYACSPVPDSYTSMLSRIDIISNDTIFSESMTYLPGSELGNLFYVQADYEFSNDEYPSISSFISAQNMDPFLFGEAGSNFRLRLREFAQIDDQTITVSINLVDQDNFTLSTDEFRVIN